MSVANLPPCRGDYDTDVEFEKAAEAWKGKQNAGKPKFEDFDSFKEYNSALKEYRNSRPAITFEDGSDVELPD